MKTTDNLHVIIGMGPTGLSCARYLHKLGIPFAVNDSRESPPELTQFKQEFPACEIVVGAFSPTLLARSQQLVMSPGVAVEEPTIAAQVARGIKPIGDIELFARAAQAPILAITGSNGKSTVTQLLRDMLVAAGKKACMGGNIGVPALSLLEQPLPDAYVVELSSFQLETTYSLKAHAAVITNISSDHMDRYHGSDELYLQAKQRVYNNCQHAIINLDEPIIWEKLNLKHKIGFSKSAPITSSDYGVATIGGERWLMHGQEQIWPVAKMRLYGQHDIQNALTALALGATIGADLKQMASVLEHFEGLPHRCQYVAALRGVEFYNDSKGTNVGATLSALSNMGSRIKGKIVLLVGGQTKAADLTPLLPAFEKYVKKLILMGEDGPLFAKLVQDRVPYMYVNNIEEAVAKAVEAASANDIVLLSPAGASFDWFKNYSHRGQMFMEAVKRYVETHA